MVLTCAVIYFVPYGNLIERRRGVAWRGRQAASERTGGQARPLIL